MAIKKVYLNATITALHPHPGRRQGCIQPKAEALQRIFFPPPPAADLTDISNPATQYPREVSVSTQITMQQIERAINKLAPNKAPGPDDISNAVLKRNAHLLMPYIQKIAQASLDINHFPAPFKNTITIVLRKPSKPDYTKPSSYRPIALENTIGKVIESIITDMIVYLTEEHSLLPLHHFGGRPCRTTEDAMIILLENIYRAWKQGDVYTAIFMDVAGAFNNVHHERLLHNMRTRRLPGIIIKWVASFLNH